MDGLDQPQLDGVALILEVELLHLLCRSLGHLVVLLHNLPESKLAKVLCLVLPHNLEKHNSFRNSKGLLLANVELSSVFFVNLNHEVVILVAHHLVTPNLAHITA